MVCSTAAQWYNITLYGNELHEHIYSFAIALTLFQFTPLHFKTQPEPILIPTQQIFNLTNIINTNHK